MRTALILHGKPSKEGYYAPQRESESNEHWIPWLQHQLLLKDILTQTPEWPKPYEPKYPDWLEVFKQFNVNKETTLIGHSCGGGFLVRWLSETDVKIDKLILVAPWLDPKKTLKEPFFDFVIDKNLHEKASSIDMLSSTDDDEDILESVDLLLKNVKSIKHHVFEGYGHFCFSDMNSKEFPELLELIV